MSGLPAFKVFQGRSRSHVSNAATKVIVRYTHSERAGKESRVFFEEAS
jgi:hypothetical protein